MAHLDKLTISKRVMRLSRPRRRSDSTEYRRDRLIARIDEQIELVQLAIAGKPLQLERKRGHDVVTVRPRPWWTVDDDGAAATEVRYNEVALNLAGKGRTIEVRSLEKLVPAYRTVIRAVKAGELDAAIDRALPRSRR